MFRTDLGPCPEREIPCPNEDTEFGRQLMAVGERLRYEPSAVVYHRVPEKRSEETSGGAEPGTHERRTARAVQISRASLHDHLP